jgi:hypothetical protein
MPTESSAISQSTSALCANRWLNVTYRVVCVCGSVRIDCIPFNTQQTTMRPIHSSKSRVLTVALTKQATCLQRPLGSDILMLLGH